jgi:hypothetical protein
LRQSISGHGQSRQGGQGHRTRASASASATSSSTSLGFKETDSDAGSQKGGNRSSFMRFMKGRSSEDDGIGGESLLQISTTSSFIPLPCASIRLTDTNL